MPSVKSIDVPSDTYHDSVRAILHSMLEALKAEHGAVSLISGADASLKSYVSLGSPPYQGTCTSVARWVVAHGEPLALETQEQTLLVPDLIIDSKEALPLVCVPIQVNSTTVGALQSSFPPVIRQEELLQKQYFIKQAADLMGYVIENDTLRRKLQEAKELGRKVSNISLEIQEKERERLILELHDGAAQTLSSAFQYLQTVDHLGSFRDEYVRQCFVRALGLVRQAIQETRGIINSITPATLDVLGLVTTVRQELKQFGKETGCQVNFQSATWRKLPRHMELAIYRIIREAVNNVRRHAKSPKLEVELRQEQKWFVIRVQDWGIGFIPDKEELFPSNRSMGLLSMRRRAEFLGGTFKINSSLGKGTEIIVDIPRLSEDE